MNRVLIVCVLIVAGIAGLGFYLGWFTFTSDSTDGKGHIGVTIDKAKFDKDEKEAQKKLRDMGDHLKGKATTPTEKGNAPAAPPGPQP
jgi:hypothetical protein